jgi:hypothetical protein
MGIADSDRRTRLTLARAEIPSRPNSEEIYHFSPLTQAVKLANDPRKWSPLQNYLPSQPMNWLNSSASNPLDHRWAIELLHKTTIGSVDRRNSIRINHRCQGNDPRELPSHISRRVNLYPVLICKSIIAASFSSTVSYPVVGGHQVFGCLKQKCRD